MTGLEFICDLYNIKRSFISDKLGIHRANLTMWFKSERPIPQNRVEEISNLLPNVPVEYIVKTSLTKEDKKEIVKIFINSLALEHEIKIKLD